MGNQAFDAPGRDIFPRFTAFVAGPVVQFCTGQEAAACRENKQYEN
jgi:hypothetical protein